MKAEEWNSRVAGERSGHGTGDDLLILLEIGDCSERKAPVCHYCVKKKLLVSTMPHER